MKYSISYASFLDLSLDIIDRISWSNATESYSIICDTLSKGLKFDYAEVWLRDINEPILKLSDFRYTTDSKTENFSIKSKNISFSFGEGLPGIAWKTKSSLWIKDVTNEPVFLRRKEAKLAGLKTCYVFPILAEDYLDGVIILYSKHSLEENPRIIKLMNILSSRIGSNIIKKELSEIVNHYEKEATQQIDLISKIFNLRDPYTITHEIHVRNFAAELGKKLNFTPTQLNDLKFAATLHDIGKIAIPMEILSKPSKLNFQEFELIKTHVTISYDLIKDLVFSDEVKRMVLEHHERLDGSGYPSGKKGEELLFSSQLLAITDVVSAMLENRPYRTAHKKETVIEELVKYSNIKYNAEIVKCAIELLENIPDHYFILQ